MGRSRGGLTTKIQALVNENGLPLRFHLTPGQVHDASAAKPLRTGLQPGQQVLADKAYDADWIRRLIWEQGAEAVIPSKSNRKIPPSFNKKAYKNRNIIERFFGRIKRSYRRIATRYEKLASNYMAMMKIAAIRLWCQFYESVT